jgi:hypothetical protein
MTAWVEHNTGEALYAHEAIEGAYHSLIDHGVDVDVGHWQGIATSGKPDLVTKEIINLTFTAQIPNGPEALAQEVKPNLPWAEVEFAERVGGVPRNPHVSLPLWPHWHGQAEQTMDEAERGVFTFSHTYSERFWPREAGGGDRFGIRYRYGDLNDVLDLLRRQPYTRQATFPIFFPEDTGAVHGGRIPCTLHYHFLLRGNRLHMWYPLRSCDAYRHFRDDIYMAMRLNQWVIEQLALWTEDGSPMIADTLWDRVKPGVLCFTAYSFHVHMGDFALLMRQLTDSEPNAGWPPQ